jgi:lipopolysaccharide biosynthesis glycosyltransferase
MINIFIGFDNKERAAYNTLSWSLIKNSTTPLAITPIALNNLQDTFTRERNVLSSTEFSFSRFMIPHLMGYKGWAIFMDCDMLVLDDITHLWDLRDDKYAVQVCKHDYTPKSEKKFLGQVQTKYEKKNWSSVMLMNCEKCTALTPEYVNSATGLQLHQFKWLESENLIGGIPLEWNWLAGEYETKEDVSNIHYTEGGPWFQDSRDAEYAEYWDTYYRETLPEGDKSC